MKRPKIRYYSKPKLTSEFVETRLNIKQLSEYTNDLEKYCDYLEDLKNNAASPDVSERLIYSLGECVKGNDYMIKADDVSERLIYSLGECVKGNDYMIKADDDGTYWIEHIHVGSGEPLEQWINDTLNLN